MKHETWNNKKFLKYIGILILILIFSCGFGRSYTYASMVGIDTQLDGMEGNAKYAGSKYRHNYKLDIEPLGPLEAGSKVFHDLANSIWNGIYWVAFLGIAIFYHAMSLDFASLLSNQLNSIQATLHKSVYEPLFQIALIGVFIVIVIKYSKRDFTGIIEEFGKILFITILSTLLVRDSSTMLSYATNITKGLCISVLSGISGVEMETDQTGEEIQIGDGVKLYAKQASGVLWVSLIHEAWIHLEFGSYTPTEDEVEAFLSTSDPKERKKLVEQIAEEHPEVFSKERNGERIGQGYLMISLIVVKAVLYLLMGVLQIVMQVVAIVFIIFSPVVLFLALLPSYGFDVLQIWAKKIFETQLGVILITFLMGIMILLSSLVNGLSKQIGWFTSLLIEILIGGGLFYFRNQLFGMFDKTRHMVSHPAALKQYMKYGMDPFSTVMLDRDLPTRNQYRRSQYQERRYQHPEDADEEVTSRFRPSQHIADPDSENEGGQYIDGQEHFTEGSGRYYPTYQETENWRELWRSSNRPSTDQSKPGLERAPLRSREQEPTMDSQYLQLEERPLEMASVEPVVTSRPILDSNQEKNLKGRLVKGEHPLENDQVSEFENTKEGSETKRFISFEIDSDQEDPDREARITDSKDESLKRPTTQDLYGFIQQEEGQYFIEKEDLEEVSRSESDRPIVIQHNQRDSDASITHENGPELVNLDSTEEVIIGKQRRPQMENMIPPEKPAGDFGDQEQLQSVLDSEVSGLNKETRPNIMEQKAVKQTEMASNLVLEREDEEIIIEEQKRPQIANSKRGGEKGDATPKTSRKKLKSKRKTLDPDDVENSNMEELSIK